MANADDLRARLLVATLEEKLITLKGSEEVDPADLRHAKERLRLAREKHRSGHRMVSLDEIDATAEPEPVQASAQVEGN
jgi:hypothetical protein